jgi:hypothetical protein
MSKNFYNAEIAIFIVLVFPYLRRGKRLWEKHLPIFLFKIAIMCRLHLCKVVPLLWNDEYNKV